MKIKRLIPTWLTLAVLLFAGCEKMKINEYRGPEDSKIEFSVDGSHSSSIAAWAVGSQIGVYTSDAAGSGGANINSAFAVEDGNLDNSGKATFTGSLSISTPTGTGKLYAYYPHTSIGIVTSYDAVSLTLPTTQTMNGTTYDSNYAYMSASTDLTVAANGNSLNFKAGNLSFQPLTGIVNVKVTGFDTGSAIASSVSATDIVTSVSVTASGAATNPSLAGSFTLDLSTGVMTFASGSNRVTANCPSSMSLGSLTGKMAVNPFKITGDEESLNIRIAIGELVLSKTIAAEDIVAASSSFEVTAGNESVIEVVIDDTWDTEDNVPGRVEGLYLVTNNVGPHTLTFGWEELETPTARTYVVQLFANPSDSSPLFTSPTMTYATNNGVYTETTGARGPTRFTFTELEPETTYYMRVRHSSLADNAYSEFISGKTEAAHVSTPDEVFYQGFDKFYWGGDPMNGAMGIHPSSYSAGGATPVGFDKLDTSINSNQNHPTLVTYGAFIDENDYFGVKNWRYSTNAVYTQPGYVRMGGASANAGIRTTVMGSDVLPAEGADCTLSFKASPFVINADPGVAPGYLTVCVVHSEVSETITEMILPTDFTNILSFVENSGLDPKDTSVNIFIGIDNRDANYRWYERTFEIPGLKPTDKIWFQSVGTSYRFLLDDILIKTKDNSNVQLRTPVVTFDDTAKSTDELKVEWTPVSRAVSYTVEYKKTADAVFVEAAAGITATGYVLTNLDDDTGYQVRVKAIAENPSLNSEYSAVVSSTTLAIVQSKLDAPGGVAAATAFSTAEVTWTAVGGATGYTIAVDGTDKETVGAVTAYTVTGLDFGTQYGITVKALAADSQYDSDYSTAVQATTKNVYLATNHLNTNSLCLGWEETSSTRTYVVQLFTDKNGSAGFTSPTLTYKTGNGLYTGTYAGTDREGYGPTRFAFIELEPNTTYYMRVKHSTADDSEYSAFIEGKTQPLHTAVTGEVLWQGFDKMYWGSDPMNSASGSQPPTGLGTSTSNPVGWSNLTRTVLSDGVSGTMSALGAFDNEDDIYGVKGWRSTTSNVAYPSPGYMKLGNTSNNGCLITPAMGDALPEGGAECTLSFKACPFVLATDPGKQHGLVKVHVIHTDVTGTAEPTDITNILSYAGNKGENDTEDAVFIGIDDRTANYQWVERTFTIPNLKPTDKIWIKSEGTAYRFLLDEIHVVKK